MSNPDPIIELKGVRLRIELLEQAFRQIPNKEDDRIFLIWFELGSAYATYNILMAKIKEAKLQGAEIG